MIWGFGMTDRQGFNAGWDHRLRKIPPASSQSKGFSLSLSLLLFILYCGLFNKWEGFPLGLTYCFNVFWDVNDSLLRFIDGFLKLEFHCRLLPLLFICFSVVCVCLLCLQVLSMSRLGGAAAVAPLVADMSPEVFQKPFFFF
jgi:uncharacterized membrane protein YhdT